jgi:hypothetical protein
LSGGGVTGDPAGAEDGGPPQRRTGWSLQRVALMVVVLAGLAIIPFGGWSSNASLHRPAQIGLNEANDGLPWKITVTGGRLVDDQPPLVANVPGDRWIIILATVEITADKSRDDLSDALRISGAEGVVKEVNDAPTVVALLSDFTNVPYLQPGLAEQLAFGWQQAPSAPVPTHVQVTIIGKTYRRSALTQTMEWLDDAPRAVVDVPIIDRRGA